MSVMSEIDLDRRLYGKECKALEREMPTMPDPYKPKSVFRPKRSVKYDNDPIVMFARLIAPVRTEYTDFCQSFRIISMQNKKPKKSWHMKWADVDAVYQGYYTNPKGEKFVPNHVEIINSIKFYPSKDYYITKNSFKTKHKTKNGESQLFSLDNIVIDIDMHRNDQSGRELQLTAQNAQDIDIAIMKLFRVLYQRPDNLPVFNFAVKTGRGVQLWLRLESCAAVPMFTALYHDICVRLCAELQAVIEKNGIGLTVDTNASCDATRSVRLPFTHNSKRHDFVTEFVSLGQEKTLRQTVTLQALAQKYGVKYSTPMLSKQQQSKYTESDSDVSFSYAAKKRMMFLEWVVDNRNGDCDGYRDIILHHHHNAAIRCLSHDEAEARTYSLNEHFRSPLSKKIIKSQIFGPIHRTIDGLGYRYKNTTILADIGASAEERQYFLNAESPRDQERKQAREAKQIANAAIIAYYNAGLSYKEIAEKTGKSLRTVKTICGDLAKQNKEDRNTKIRKMSADGMSTRRIARELNISDKTVRTVLQNMTETTETTHKQPNKISTIDQHCRGKVSPTTQAKQNRPARPPTEQATKPIRKII